MLSSRSMDPASNFCIGTSGYSFRDWVGNFYPPGTKSKDMFALYVQQFRAVEINFTFYRMPTAKTLEAMARQSPPEFAFWVKAHQQFTHEHDLKGAKEFLEALEPMQARGRLGEGGLSPGQRAPGVHDLRRSRRRAHAEFGGHNT